MHNRWVVAGTTFAVWVLVGVSVVFWGLKLAARGSNTAVAPVMRSAAPADPVAVGRLLGAVPAVNTAAPVASLSSRFALLGVVAGRSHGGAALIAVDGKPAKPFRVGTPVEENLVLKSVDPRRAVLAASLDGPAVLTLELPPIRR